MCVRHVLEWQMPQSRLRHRVRFTDGGRRAPTRPGTEGQAEALDAELEDDVLELQRHTDLSELVEDELLLALPLVPRHEDCPEPLPMGELGDPEPAADAPPERPHPFAALAQLKKKPDKA